MNETKKLELLQNIYAMSLTESLKWYDYAKILHDVTKQKQKQQYKMAPYHIKQLGINTTEDLFDSLTELYNCASWQVLKDNSITKAVNKGCKLCFYAKKAETTSPCNLYCLNPIKAIMSSLNTNSKVIVHETLWTGTQCYLEIIE